MKRALFLSALLLIFVGSDLFAQIQPTIQWRFDTKDAAFGQAAAADIDGDGKLEIVFGCYRNDSMIYALNGEDGSLLWKFNAGTANFEGCNDVAPLLFDINRDGIPEVIVASSCNPKTFCFDGKTGNLIWTCKTRGSDSPPTIFDASGDGDFKILHGEFGGYVICINADSGTVDWEIAVDTDSWIQTAPTILDVDNDGDLDFVVATWNAVDKTQNKVYAYRIKDQKLLWTFSIDDVVYHGTAVGDLDDDGKPELLIGSYNDTLYCLNAEDGTLKWKYGTGYYVGGPAQIADLDNDGKCDVVFTTGHKVIALNGDGTLKWEYAIGRYKQSFRGAAIADVNNDSFPDVTFGTSGGHVISLNGNDGSVIFMKNLREDYGDSLYSIDHAPLIADFDGDGKLDVFIVGGHAEYPDFFKGFGRAYMMTIGKGNGPDWLMFQNDPWRQSNVCTHQPDNGNSKIRNTFQGQNSIHIYPNPFDKKANFEFTLSANAVVSWTISDVFGRIIEQSNKELMPPGKHLKEWQRPQSLPNGIYLFKVNINGEQIIRKMVLR